MSPIRVLLACAVWLPAVPALAAAVPPAAGIYNVTAYVLSANATNGGSCTSGAVGTYVFSTYSYPGPGKAGAVSHQILNGSGINLIEKLTYPVTPPANILTQSGKYTATFLPGGAPTTGSFAATFQLVDASSFVGNTTFVYPVSATVTCTTEWQESFVRAGK